MTRGDDYLDTHSLHDARNAWIAAHAGSEVIGLETLRDTARSAVLRVTCADTGGTREAPACLFFKEDRLLPPPEGAIVARLARHRPELVPDIVAVDERRGWSLARSAGNAGLDGAPTESWQRLARRFGELQREAEAVADWLALGCRDLRGDRLHAALLEMLDAARPHIDEDVAEALDGLRPRIAEACADLATDGVPAALVHQDLVPENVVLCGGDVVFLDWSDTVVGHPFFGLDRLLDSCWSDAGRKASVIAAYLSAFEGVLPPEHLMKSFRRVLSLRVLYEDLRWHHEITAAGADTEHAARLRRDLVAGLTLVARAAS